MVLALFKYLSMLRLVSFSVAWLVLMNSISDSGNLFIKYKPKQNKRKPQDYTPVVLTTGLFIHSTLDSWENVFNRNKTALEAVEKALNYARLSERPSTFRSDSDPTKPMCAMLFLGDMIDAGGVSDIRGFSSAISVAKCVLAYTLHSLLAGEPAEEFARTMGFEADLLPGPKVSPTDHTTNKEFTERLSVIDNIMLNSFNGENQCIATMDPSVWCFIRLGRSLQKGEKRELNNSGNVDSVTPIHEQVVTTDSHLDSNTKLPEVDSKNPKYMAADYFHYNIGQMVMDRKGSLVAGTYSWNESRGALCLAAIPGSAGFANSSVGAAIATGDDVMMTFAPAMMVVERMCSRMSPEAATMQVVDLIRGIHPWFKGALLAINRTGHFGAACYGMKKFPFSVARQDFGVRMYLLDCVTSKTN